MKAAVVHHFTAGLLLLAITVAWLTLAHPARAINLPPDFQEDTVFSGLTQPTAVSFSPDGRIFVAEKRGVIKMFTSLQDTTPDLVADLRTDVHDCWDRGLLGMALDPAFPTKNVVYVLYAYDAPIGGTAPVFNDTCTDPTGNGCVVSGRLARLTNIGTDPSQVNQQVLINDWCQHPPATPSGASRSAPTARSTSAAARGRASTTSTMGRAAAPSTPAAIRPAACAVS
jgi:hypothetical protein